MAQQSSFLQNPSFRKVLMVMVLLMVPVVFLGASQDAEPPRMSHLMAQLVLQLSMVLLATWLGGALAKLVKLPMALGWLFAGMVIGPFALGGVSLPDFPLGLFPRIDGPIPVTPMLYTFSTLASIILLFVSGLETDLGLFKRYVAKGALVGFGGVVVSFAAGAVLTMIFLGLPLSSPQVLFMGSLSVASSVGIAASILSSRRKIDSPEGTVILSAAVVDDILGIIILAVVLGITARLDQAGSSGGAIALNELLIDITFISIRAFGIWLVVTLLALRFAKTIGRGLKKVFKDRNQLAVMAFGMALLLSGLFEEAGLSMVIGAYIMGLSLSSTDLSFVIQGRLGILKEFLVPVFFAVSGMLLNFSYLFNVEVLTFGLIFAVAAILAKVIGSGGSSLLLGFNSIGALRIGLGMVPRAEVTLIIAGIGVSTGALDERMFGVALLMMVSTIIVSPPLFNSVLSNPKPGQRKPEQVTKQTETTINFGSQEFADLAVSRLILELESEGFFVNRMEHEAPLYQVRKDSIFMTFHVDNEGIAHFVTDTEHVTLIQTALYESLLVVSDATTDLKQKIKPEDLIAPNQGTSQESGPSQIGKNNATFVSLFQSAVVLEDMKALTKEEAIAELVDALDNEKLLENRAQVIADIWARENSMSTGMHDGIALPHGKTTGVKGLKIAIGRSLRGIEFQSLDGKPSSIFVLLVSQKDGSGPHLQALSGISTILKTEEMRRAILAAEGSHGIRDVFSGFYKSGRQGNK